MDIVDRDIPLGQIGRTVGPRPSSGLVRSIRRHGVLMPVLLEERFRDDGTIEYHILDGNRRVAAARRTRQSSVPGRVLQGISADEASRVTLASNSFRTSNYVTEFWAIRQLERSGFTRRAICDHAGMSESMLETRKVLTALDRRIFVGFAQGRVRPTVATAVARLDRESQRSLGDRFEQDGRLLKREVDDMRSRRRVAVREPSDSVPGAPPPEPNAGRVVSFPPPVPVDPPSPGHWEGQEITGDRVLRVVPSAGSRDAVTRVSAVVVTASTPGVDAPECTSPQPMRPSPHEPHRAIMTAPATVPPGTASPASTLAASAIPDTSDPQQRPVLSHDLRLALRTVARQAALQGLDEDGWIEAARDAWRASPCRRLHG